MRWAGGYYLLAGVTLLLVPNALLRVLGIAPAREVWVHLLGMVVGFLGYYYLVAAAEGLAGLYRATVVARGVATVIMTVIALVALHQLLLFAALDAAGAVWTGLAMRTAVPPSADRPAARGAN
jgi:hypothetical protein